MKFDESLHSACTVYTIALTPTLRSPELEAFCANGPWPWKPMQAVSVNDVLRMEGALRVDQVAATRHMGHPLTLTQIACHLSHQEVWSDAFAEGVQWAVVLEDDAIPTPALAVWIATVSAVETTEAICVSLLSVGRYATKRVSPVLRLEDGLGVLRALKWPPASAVGYMLNRSAMRLATLPKGPMYTPADWPPWAAEVSFFLTDPPAVQHLDGPSSVGNIAGPSHTRRASRALMKILGWEYISSPSVRSWGLKVYIRHGYIPSIDWAVTQILSKLRSPFRHHRR